MLSLVIEREERHGSRTKLLLRANLLEPGHGLFDKLVNGAPPMAPLLFPNLVGLALSGLWALVPHLPESTPRSSWFGAVYRWTHPQSIEGTTE